MTVTTPASNVAALTEREKGRLLERTRRSGEYFERARQVMPGGVPSSFQRNDPWPTYVERGVGAEVWDVDGNRYLDFHNGFGVMCVGHANPVIAAAVKARMDEGTHFAAPTEGSIVVAEELRRRWGLPHWRFTNSGTESTMDAVHLARGLTGRNVILKIEGSYHGHHDAVMVSVKPPADQMGDRDHPNAIPYGLGYAAGTAEGTRPVPFNDAEAVERALAELEGEVAGLILEPAMMNINIVRPVEGYLERLRELCTQHGIPLIYDEVKTGAAIAAGGATELFGVTPDMVCLAKAICGGLPGGAIGMSDEVAALVESGAVRQQGTFNGNPLVMAAAEATLLEVLTPEAYAHLHELNERLMDGCERIIGEYGLPAHTVGMGSKGCVIFSTEPVLRVPRLLHEDPPRADRPRVALPHEPRHLHDAGPGRGVDALGRPHRRAPRELPRGVRVVRARRDEVAPGLEAERARDGLEAGREEVRLQFRVGEGPVGQALGVGGAVNGDRHLELAGVPRVRHARAPAAALDDLLALLLRELPGAGGQREQPPASARGLVTAALVAQHAAHPGERRAAIARVRDRVADAEDRVERPAVQLLPYPHRRRELHAVPRRQRPRPLDHRLACVRGRHLEAPQRQPDRELAGAAGAVEHARARRQLADHHRERRHAPLRLEQRLGHQPLVDRGERVVHRIRARRRTP